MTLGGSIPAGPLQAAAPASAIISGFSILNAKLEPSHRAKVCRWVNFGDAHMNRKMGIAVLSGLLTLPLAAHAQGVIGGAERGSAEGGYAAGPVGAAVGGVVGGVTGGVEGILGADEGPRFHDYVVRTHRSSYRYAEPLEVGSELPPQGIDYYSVPEEYHVSPAYRYTVVNGHAVLVDPRTRRVVQVID